MSAVSSPYPAKASKFNDEARVDKGNNFGRVARGRLMDDFIAMLLEEPVSGIPAKHWHGFLKIFSEGVDDNTIAQKLKAIRADAESRGVSSEQKQAFDKVEDGLRELMSRA